MSPAWIDPAGLFFLPGTKAQRMTQSESREADRADDFGEHAGASGSGQKMTF